LKPPPFDYVAATSLDEALSALAEAGEDAKVLAGGQSLIPLMALRLAHPSVLIDVNGVPELGGINRVNGDLVFGAMVRHRAAERSDVVRQSAPLVADAMPLIGHLAIRSRGTVGGSLAHADPAAELPAIALALDATFTVRSRDRGERTIAAADFFEGYFTTALAADEILCSVGFPEPAANTGSCIEEVARRHGDFAMVGVAAAVTINDGIISDARLALINVAEKPVRATEAERALVGAKAGADAFADAAALAVRDLEPSADLHASAAYRRKVAGVCVRRALTTAARRATEGS
jgi:carbon-monoxide dehydrogenase medium subunit